MKPPVTEIQQQQHYTIAEINQLSEVLLDQLLGAGQGQTFDALSAEADQPLMLGNVPTLGQLDLPPWVGEATTNQPQDMGCMLQLQGIEATSRPQNTEATSQSTDAETGDLPTADHI